MKNLSISLIVVIVAMTLSVNLSAKSPSNSTLNYIEIDMLNSLNNTTVLGMDLFNLEMMSAGEQKIKTKVSDDDANHTATAAIEIFSIDGQDILGPFNITEGTTLEVEVDEREWSVRTIISTQDAEVSYWF